jgi:hypothetical protein
MAHQ